MTKPPGPQNLHPRARRVHLPLQVIQIDEQLLDAFTSIDLGVGRHVKRHRMSRATLLLALDYSSTCILGHHVAYTAHVNTDDMLGLLESIYKPFELTEPLSAGLEMPPGPWFPNQLDLDAIPLLGSVCMDNALVHHANLVTDVICNRLGASTHLGHPASPLARHIVERVFHYINLSGTHRLPSTTGSHTRDTKKEPRKHKKKPPVITIKQLEDILKVVIAEYNTRARAHLEMFSPIERFKYLADQDSVLKVPAKIMQEASFFVDSKVVKIRQSSKETRRPWINAHGMRYTLGTEVHEQRLPCTATIKFDRRDIRSVRAYDDKGINIGDFWLPKRYQSAPISAHVLKWLRAESRINQRHECDGITALLNDLKSGNLKPQDATRVARLLAGTSAPTELASNEANNGDSDFPRWQRSQAFTAARKPHQ